MLQNDLKFLEEAFKEYYFDHFDLIHVPDRSREREYGYKKFNSGMIRHISCMYDLFCKIDLDPLSLYQK